MYGSPRINPVNETTPPSPLSPYALSKLLGEHVIKYYASQYGFSYLILRYANVYGPRQNPHGEAGVVAIFGGLMKSGKQPTIFGDGTKARDYVYAIDVARANTIALTRGINETVNLGTGKKTTDDMIFYAAAEATGYIGKPHYAPYRKGEVYQITLDARKAEKVLGWTPKMKLQEGIRKTLAEL